ncbi:MAG: PorV/PorQ family protein [Elusimicrobia bacterium]|nr:PorV/PorQ family protein [Elusimicrobiota bacterium]
MENNGKKAVNTYKDLNVWKRSYELSLEVYRKTANFPNIETYGLTAQMRRAAVSIACNIAEGNGRQSRKEYLQFLSIAHGSLSELETQTMLAKDLGYITQEDFQKIHEKEMEVNRMLLSLISALKKTPPRSLVLSLIPLSLIPLSLAHASGVGTTGAAFLRIPVGARAAGMASAYSPFADDITAIYWNPAGLARMEKKEVSLSYNAYFADASAQFVGYGHPTSKGTFAGAVNLFGVKDIEKRSITGGDADTPDLGSFKTQDLAAIFGWGYKFDIEGKNLNVGAAVKYISSDLGDTTGVGLTYGNVDAKAATFAADLGAMMDIGEPEAIAGGTLNGSLAVLNLGGEIKFKDESDPLPLNVKPGVAWKRKLADRDFAAALDADILVNDSKNYVNLGFEYWLIEQLGLRAGYQLGRDKGAGLGIAAGMGFKHAGLGVDYAFVPFGDLGDTHRVSLSYKF